MPNMDGSGPRNNCGTCGGNICGGQKGRSRNNCGARSNCGSGCGTQRRNCGTQRRGRSNCCTSDASCGRQAGRGRGECDGSGAGSGRGINCNPETCGQAATCGSAINTNIE